MVRTIIQIEDAIYSEQIKTWKLNSQNGDLTIHMVLNDKTKIVKKLDYCKVYPFEQLTLSEDEVFELNGEISKNIESSVIYGDKYAVVSFRGGKHRYIYKKDAVKKVRLENTKLKNLLNYFSFIAGIKDRTVNGIPAILEGQIHNLPLRTESALHAYFTKTSQSFNKEKKLIYPFGLNLSQIQAVESAFSSQVSVIEGPPGTGKTQTILNIISNIVMQGKNAAIVSSNNSAVANVSEKLMKSDLGFFLASLGSQVNQKKFFENPPKLPQDFNSWEINMNVEVEMEQILWNNIRSMKELLELQNKQAVIKQQIKDLEMEQKYYTKHFESLEAVQPKLLPFYKFTKSKIIDFLVDEALNHKNRMTLFKQTKYLFYYGLYSPKQIKDQSHKEKIITQLQYHFYRLKLEELKSELKRIEDILEMKNFNDLTERIQLTSKQLFKSYLNKKGNFDRKTHYTQGDFKKSKYFSSFIDQFPIILSTAFSLQKSIPAGFLFDYLIIDEASQLELMPGILALGCAKNVVIVGDRNQLPHIPDTSAELSQFEIESCFNYVKNSMLDSIIKVYKNRIPITLLKEHYRCEPMIIKFCNEQYYDGKLIPLTKQKSDNEPSIVLIKTVKGNHMRFQGGKHNIRELDSLDEDSIKNLVFPESYETGFIAPYREQINHAEQRLPEEILKDTVHKFQGRECDGIIFSTVLDKKGSKNDVQFVDSANLINVAISRAKKRFVLVSDVEVFKKSNKEISELIRYMEYYTESSLYHESKVISVFDLLYKEFSEVLIERENKLRKSDSKYKTERIIASLLRDILSEEKFKKINFKREYRLKDLVNDTSHLHEDEKQFIKTAARVDFLLHYKMGNEPLGVIEVDGVAYHHSKDQKRRDRIKNTILDKAGIPILRLRTNESREPERIKQFLNKHL
ncbi:AAA domain-containing protein [Bacillus velezensis]|uniref:AAA domain-containing protein n=1 Tax=Bacillus velezensis TaxID=492670 RepID=UPI000F029D8E|nr:AAA domain-containing protein [Bacillus velezensis]MEC2353647.1 AAA domain-containing protein [Bacillus velezensis]MED3399107.1 AAA domain-containing protein [Bacillus velezensis]